MLTPQSSIPGILWPAAPSARSAALLAVLFQLEQSQWLSRDSLDALQRLQLSCLVKHAYETVPFYQQRFDQAGLNPQEALESDNWLQVPPLTRREVQTAGEALSSTQIPRAHGPVSTLMTSGSTGAPVIVHGTGVTGTIWKVLTLRDHVWHGRDFAKSFAAIRYVRGGAAGYPAGARMDNWGSPTQGVVATGPAFLLSIQSTVEEQAEWLERINPHYLLSYPTVLASLARLFRAKPSALSNLCEVRSFGEVLDGSCRSACAATWNVKVTDAYSAQETGYIALQCPDTENYHVQSESVLVEVIDERGQPCRPGEIGRVVVTTLHNFATPLVRYDIGDFAEVGETCSCGRGLAVLRRIIGRQRNLLVLPSGERRWPVFGEGERPDDLPAFRQFQVVQVSLDRIEVKIVCDAPLSEPDQEKLKHYVQQTLGYPFEVTLKRVDKIVRHASGKFEDFISLVRPGPA